MSWTVFGLFTPMFVGGAVVGHLIGNWSFDRWVKPRLRAKADREWFEEFGETYTEWLRKTRRET